MSFTYRDLCGPDPSPMTIAEAEALTSLCKELPANPTIIQIGAERGASTVAMLTARPNAFVFSVDCGARPEEAENVEKAGFDVRRVVRGLGRSQNIGQHWPEAWACDLLYIDGDHRLAGISKDIELWPRHVRQGGYLVFHDWIPAAQRPAHIIGRVWEAITEWEATHPPFDHLWTVERLRVYQRWLDG